MLRLTDSIESIGRAIVSHLRIVVAALVFAGALTVVLWTGEILYANESGIIYTIVSLTAPGQPGAPPNRDIPVAFAAGVGLAWLILFVIDITKRPQVPIVGLGALVAGGWFVLEGHVIGSISRQPVVFILALIGTLVITAGLSLQIYDLQRSTELSFWQKVRWAQFPAAVIALFGTVSVLTVVITLQYLLTSPNLFRTALALLSACLLVIALAVFVGYRFERRVTVVAQNPEYMSPVLGGLLAEVRGDPHYGFTFKGDGELYYLEGGEVMNQLTNPVGFGFLRKVGRLRQIVTIEATPVLQRNFLPACETIGGEPMAEPGTTGITSLISDILYRLWRVLPVTVRSGLLQWHGRLTSGQSNPTRVIERFDSANIILLITTAEGPHDEEWINAIQTVHWHYHDDADVIVLAIDAEESDAYDTHTDYSDDENLDALSDGIKNELGLPSTSELIPIDRDQDIGYDRLRDRVAGIPYDRQRH